MELPAFDINASSPGRMMAVPLAIFCIAAVVLLWTTVATGMPVTPGIDFAGGTSVTIFTDEPVQSVTDAFSGYPMTEKPVRPTGGGTYLRFGPMSDAEFESLTDLVDERYSEARIDHIGVTFGETLQSQAMLALIFSFVGMAIVVFAAFRVFIPSVAVVASAISDIVITAAAMNVLGIALSLATTAALLMLIGYSVDSDILLTTRVLKRRGKVGEKLPRAFRTGVIMTTTTLSAVAAMWVVTTLGQVQVIAEISAVLFIGLVVDLMNTWLMNAGLIKWYVYRRGER